MPVLRDHLRWDHVRGLHKLEGVKVEGEEEEEGQPWRDEVKNEEEGHLVRNHKFLFAQIIPGVCVCVSVCVISCRSVLTHTHTVSVHPCVGVKIRLLCTNTLKLFLRPAD